MNARWMAQDVAARLARGDSLTLTAGKTDLTAGLVNFVTLRQVLGLVAFTVTDDGVVRADTVGQVGS